MRERRGNLSWGKSLSAIGRPELTLLATLLIAAALFGGSSRYDVMQNVLMQPIAWIVAGVTLALGGIGKMAPRELRWPLLMLLALLVLTLLQLVPLGQGMWTSLPGREPLADIASAIGSDGARPMSMVPSRTLNALASIGIPLAALLLMARMGYRGVYPLLVAIVALAAANTIMGFLQIATGFSSAGYFYSVTNVGTLVGIFANRNHSAVFGALAMLIIAFLATREQRKSLAGADLILWATYAAIFLTLLVNGSRAGLLTAGVALVATALLVVNGRAAAPAGAKGKSFTRYIPAAVILAFAVGMIVLFLVADRLTAFQRMVGVNPLEDLRFRIIPVLMDMIGSYFPLGTGIGAFEDVYRIHETADLLGPRYLNMAHNDWIQWVIETGLPGVILLLGLLVWLGFQLLRLKALGRDYLVFGLAGIAILAIASYFDYPLRTPIFQVAGVWFICALALIGRERKDEKE